MLDWIDTAIGFVGLVVSVVGSIAFVTINLGWEPSSHTTALMASSAMIVGGGARIAVCTIMWRIDAMPKTDQPRK